MLPWACSVIDHRGRQNLSLFFPHFDLICDRLLSTRGDEWSIKIFNYSQNLISARLLVLPKFLRCSQARQANFLFLLVLAKKSQ